MNADKFLILTLAAAMSLAIAACGGGGGGGSSAPPADPNPAFATAVSLAQIAGASFSAGVAINDDSVVVGRTDGAAAPATPQAVVWTVTVGTAPDAPTSEARLLALPALHGPYGAANGINDSGVIVGDVEVTANGLIVPAYWPGQEALAADVVLLSLGATATQGAAYGINSAGRIAGEVTDAGVAQAVTWDTATATAPTLLPTTTPAPPTTASAAYFVNDNDEIVGELTDADGVHAVVWRTLAGIYGEPIRLSPPNALAGSGIALSINTAGDIVGEVEDTVSGLVHAVRWTPEAGASFAAVDLGPAGESSGAAGINETGRTVGHVADVASAWGQVDATPVTMHATLVDSKALAINNLEQAVGISGGQAFVALPQ